MIGIWTEHGAAHLGVLAVVTTLLFSLPLLFQPLFRARRMAWEVPAQTDLAIHVGRCLGAFILIIHGAAAHAQGVGGNDGNAMRPESELSYRSYVHSDKRIKCLYGYAANKTGDHAAAIVIFEDCIRRWNDVFSMIGLAQMYETGIGIRYDPAQSTALMRRAALQEDGSSYPSLARYHYGVALAEGVGVPANTVEARRWLHKAAEEGVAEAADYLARLDRAAPQVPVAPAAAEAPRR